MSQLGSGCNRSKVIEFVGDPVTDVYMESHHGRGEPYKTIHYSSYGSLVDYVLGVYDKVVPTQTFHRKTRSSNSTKIPLVDLEDSLALVLGKHVSSYVARSLRDVGNR